MTIKKNKLFNIFYLLFVSFIYVYYSILNTNSWFVYSITLVLISVSVIKAQSNNYLNANNLFLAYYIYVLALGPIVFINKNIYLNFSYYIYILGGLLCFAWGNLLGNIRIACKEYKNRSFLKVKFNIKRIYILRLLWAVSIFAGILYAYKNMSLLFGDDLQNGRVEAMAGNGILIQLAQMSIITIPMLYDIYYDAPRLYNKRFTSIIELCIMTGLSFFVLLLQGYRSYALTVALCLAIAYLGKNKSSSRKALLLGIAGIFFLEVLGLFRNLLSSSTTQNMGSFSMNFLNSLVVNCSNLGYVFETFPLSTPFQYGYTYFMNYLILRPGPDIDFTLWLKEQVGIAFAGGGRTASILGESYINFGTWFIFVSMILMGIVGVMITRYLELNNYNFWGVYLMWQFAHSASGGISNVILPLTLNGIVYIFIKMFPIDNNIKKAELESNGVSDG